MRVTLIASKVESGYVTPYWPSLKIKAYDIDNLYPQHIQDIVGASSTGSTCCGRYASFIEGNGFASAVLSEFKGNRSGATMDDIHHLCAQDLAMFGGFALHVNYNLLGKVVSLAHVPFENCRLEEEDDSSYVARIAVFPDWRGRKTRNGRVMRPTLRTVDYIDVFNPDPEVVQAQIEAAGGIEQYKGQILYISNQGKDSYPMPVYSAVLTEMSTDEGLANVRNRNTRNNFFPAGMLITKKGAAAPGTEEQESESDGFEQAVIRFQGDMALGKIMGIRTGIDEEEPKFVPFSGENYDQAFTYTDTAVVERIYAAFNQDAFYCIRIGKTGFSGDIVNDAEMFYARSVTKEQRMLTRAYKSILSHWHYDLGDLISNENITIEPLVKSIAESVEKTTEVKSDGKTTIKTTETND